MSWKDETSGPGQNQRETDGPTTWKLEGCEFAVFIHRWKRERGWYLTSKRLGIDTFDLRSGDDLEAAKTNAMACIRERLASMASSFENAVRKAD
jgi:hypothetical protein